MFLPSKLFLFSLNHTQKQIRNSFVVKIDFKKYSSDFDLEFVCLNLYIRIASARGKKLLDHVVGARPICW